MLPAPETPVATERVLCPAPRELERAKWEGCRKPGGRRRTTEPLRQLLASSEIRYEF